MVAQPTENAKPAPPIPWRPDDWEYWTVYEGKPIRLLWSEMNRQQRLLQIEAEKRQSDIEEFGIYS